MFFAYPLPIGGLLEQRFQHHTVHYVDNLGLTFGRSYIAPTLPLIYPKRLNSCLRISKNVSNKGLHESVPQAVHLYHGRSDNHNHRVVHVEADEFWFFHVLPFLNLRLQ